MSSPWERVRDSAIANALKEQDLMRNMQPNEPRFHDIVERATSFAAPPSAELSRTFSAAGVGDDGWTTYLGFGVVSAEVFSQPSGSASTTVFSPPFTVSATVIAGASGFRHSAGRGIETCTFGADGRGACVVLGPSVAGGATFMTKTFSGTAVPFYTLAAATGTTPPTSATSTAPLASTSTGAAQRKAATSLSVMAIVLGAALCLL
ncbi:hypothetical protein FB451DRAFT_1365211 [Mycena latifolia]|nr:hypothetical protein FB451DRAFT_1365211 [Mycena latifolia]